jgi:pimeloyl-ACP methyl ester carboxylesterase
VRQLPVAVPGEPVLAGTLALPDGPGPFPAALIASGSGPLDRDSNHRRARFDVARQLAAALADAGLASLRYDKRGVGGTAGDWRAAGFTDNVDDLGRALQALAARPEIDGGRIVLVGHSEGALLSAAVAGRGAAVRGVVLLAGSATPGEELLRWQGRQLAPTLPRAVRGLLRLLRTDLAAKAETNRRRIAATTGDVARIGGARINARWFREFMAHDPREDLRRLTVPVLAITGTKDLQARPDDLTAVADLVAGPVETHRVPDLTHTLRRQDGPATMRSYREELRRPVDAEVLATVAGWCRRLTGDAPPD